MYNYEKEKPRIFTDKGQQEFLKLYDRARQLLEESGAFMMLHVCSILPGNSYSHIACVDRLVELGIVREVTSPHTANTNRVFVKAHSLERKRNQDISHKK